MPKNLKLFATKKYPLRASSLDKLASCAMQGVMMFLEQDDESGPAAHTGTAMHHAAHTWHMNGHDYDESIRQMKAKKGDYPLANLSEAELMFRHYSKDTRNVEAKVIKVEQEVKITLPPAKEDKTKEEIVIIGHLDQLRQHADKKYYLHDIKTSKKSGNQLLEAHIFQIAAYCHGATKLMKKPVHPGTLICPRGYLTTTACTQVSPLGVFFHFSWTIEHVPHILNGIRSIVAAIRNSSPWINPGEYCRWCPAKGIHYCIPKLAKLNRGIELL